MLSNYHLNVYNELNEVFKLRLALFSNFVLQIFPISTSLQNYPEEVSY